MLSIHKNPLYVHFVQMFIFIQILNALSKNLVDALIPCYLNNYCRVGNNNNIIEINNLTI